jgi:hypothetical protein
MKINASTTCQLEMQTSFGQSKEFGSAMVFVNTMGNIGTMSASRPWRILLETMKLDWCSKGVITQASTISKQYYNCLFGVQNASVCCGL